MSLSVLPNEIFTQILRLLSFNDQKSSMQANHEWHGRFQASVLRSVHIKTTREFKQFLYLLQLTHKTHESLGILIRKLTLGPRVGFIQAEFEQLPKYCPYLEYLEFNSELWRYFKYTDSIETWKYLYRYPSMNRTRLALPLLWHMGHDITQLEFDAVMIDELAKTHFSVISILTHTPNLKSLQLEDGTYTSQNMSISEFESIHKLCPRLETLYLDGFNSHVIRRVNNQNTTTINSISENFPVPSRLRHLRLGMAIHSEELLLYWAHKYPLIEDLDIRLRLLEPEYYHEAVQPENSSMKESFALMATRFSKLKKIKARFDEKYFPCDVFLRGLNNSGIQDVSIHFFNFDYHRRSARNFKLLMARSIDTITCINISNWDRSWDYETDLLLPVSQCNHLEQLSLSPQPGTLTEFDIDIILDHCTRLKRLKLANTYNLFVRDDTNDHIDHLHPLESLTLQHTMVNNRLFDYLAVRCPLLHTLDISHITKPYDNKIQVKINMPSHHFRSIRIEKLQLGLRIEDAGFQCNHYSTICSIEQNKTKRSKSIYPENWYHLYQPKGLIRPRLQKLNDADIEKIKMMQITKQLWEQISFVGSRIRYEDKKKWYLDIPYGYFSVRCKSVDEFIFEGTPI